MLVTSLVKFILIYIYNYFLYNYKDNNSIVHLNAGREEERNKMYIYVESAKTDERNKSYTNSDSTETEERKKTYTLLTSYFGNLVHLKMSSKHGFKLMI